MYGYRSMVRGMHSRPRRPVWRVGSVIVLLIATLAGGVAIARHSGFGTALAARNDSVAITTRSGSSAHHRASTSPRAPAPSSGPTASGPAPSARHRAGSPSPSPSPSSSPPPVRPGAAPIHFRTLPPGAKLPSGAQCARWVRASPGPEVRPENKVYNHTGGEHVRSGFLSDAGPKGEKLARRIDGDFTGTTQEILRWAACKWGIDQNMVFAQAAVESWWRQTALGDFGTQASACPPGHGLGADGKPGMCPQSYGILQNRYPYEEQSWPGIGRSTAMNADTAYAIWRACYDGYETWLNTVPRGSQYHAGDAWGCVGRWFAGRWRTAAADGYIKKVRQYMTERIWETRDFKARADPGR